MFIVHNLNDDSWYMSTLKLNYNYVCVTPSKVDLMDTYKNISRVMRELIKTLEQYEL